MSVQLRHKLFGVYQGSFLGLGLWYPESGMPEQGFVELPSELEAQAFVEEILAAGNNGQREDYTIEPFDRETSERIIREGNEKIKKERAGGVSGDA